jgi:hypothetical protein
MYRSCGFELGAFCGSQWQLSNNPIGEILEKYWDAQRYIFLMQAECIVLAAVLSQLQIIFPKTSESLMSRYPSFLLEALYLVLVGWPLTSLVLSREFDSFTGSSNGDTRKKSKGKKVNMSGKMNNA